MTWNFPCYQYQDGGTGVSRGASGSCFGLGTAPGPAISETSVQPFSTSISVIGSFLLRSDYTADGIFQVMTSIGQSVKAGANFAIQLDRTTANDSLEIYVVDYGAGGTTRYHIDMGDEAATTWLQEDKWYQFVFSADATSMQYAMNGDTTPTVTVNTNAPGALGLNNGSDRLWHGASAWHSAANPNTLTSSLCSYVSGPWAYSATKLDLTDSTTINRIFDADGNLKNPGADGSLWFGDTYGGTQPTLWLPNGCPEFGLPELTGATPGDNAWVDAYCGIAGSNNLPGGLRKEYE